MYAVLLLALVLGMSCEKRSLRPIKTIKIEKNVSSDLKNKVQSLKQKIKNVDVETVKSKLNKLERIRFQKRLDDTRGEVNDVIEAINKGENTNSLQMSSRYVRAKTMWDYLVKNFNI